MDKGNLCLKAPFTVRATDEEMEFLNEFGSELNPNFNYKTTAREFVFWMLSKLTNQVKAAAPAQVDPEAILLLNNKIGELKTLIDLKDEKIQNLSNQINKEKEVYQQEQFKLGENDEVITFDPIFKGLIDIEIEATQKKKGIIYTRAQVLKNLFLDMIKGKDSYPLSKMWSTADLVTYKKKITTPQNQ